MKHIAATFFLLVSFAVEAQPQVAEATPEELDQYKMKTAAACVSDAVQEGTAANRAHLFCACMTDLVWQTMPSADLQVAYQHSQQNAKFQELKVLAPYIRQAARRCKASPHL